jgi:hypothetical protein
MSDEVGVSLEAVNDALRLAVANLDDQLTAIDAAIAHHEARARELRQARTRVKRVHEVVYPTAKETKGNGRGSGKTSDGLARVGAATVKRHAAEREAKKNRVREELVSYYGPDVDVSGVDMLPHLNAGLNGHDPSRTIGRQLVNDLLRELRDEGLIRLHHTAAGGKEVWRLVA